MGKEVDAFLMRKWEYAFRVFFDVNRNGTLEWDDFQLLIEIIGEARGPMSDEYLSAKLALNEIWHKLTAAIGLKHDDKVTEEDWMAMWKKSLNGSTPDWQKLYLEYMFQLLDASGDKLVDQSEYIQVMGYFDISRSEATACFDKFALNEQGELVMAITYEKFVTLWEEYFTSTDMNSTGNYLLGFID
uniref:EF-hand domain-containing protein n=1 Tax=Plectus sambesii TaxID=2011161 RepID=A0A914XBD3_9BILA